MKQLVLGKTPKQVQEENEQRHQELELEIQKKDAERQAKLNALHKKQKSLKVTIIAVFVVIILLFTIFGTYNTFIKTPLTMSEVKTQIYSIINARSYPTEGLDNYLRDNCDELFDKYMSIGKKGSNISKVEILNDSCRVDRVEKLTQFVAQVFFSVDVQVTEKDKVITDPQLIEQLRKNGFNTTRVTIQSKTNSNSSSSAPSAAKTNAAKGEKKEEQSNTDVDTSNTENTNIDTQNEDSSNSGENTNEEITPTEEPIITEEPTPTEPIIVKEEEDEIIKESTNEEDKQNDVEVYVPMEETSEVVEQIEFALSKTESPKHYYILKNGTIMQTGETTKKRYNFYITLEHFYNTDKNSNILSHGYKPVSEMNLYSLKDVDVKTFDKIEVSEYLEFDKKAKVLPEELSKMQIKVEKILIDLYNKADTSLDFFNTLPFNTYDAKFEGIQSFEAYTKTNQLGFNSLVKYTITTSQGFSYTLQTYLLVEKNGSSYKITKFL